MDKEVSDTAFNLAWRRKKYRSFRGEATELQKSFPQIKVDCYADEISPICSCPLENCQHLTVLNVFENEGLGFWRSGNKEATNHAYWARMKSHGREASHILAKIKSFYKLYFDIKNNGFLCLGHPVFVVDISYFEGLWASEDKGKTVEMFVPVDGHSRRKYVSREEYPSNCCPYYRHDGHHRTDIMRFLDRKLPVMVAEIDVKKD